MVNYVGFEIKKWPGHHLTVSILDSATKPTLDILDIIRPYVQIPLKFKGLATFANDTPVALYDDATLLLKEVRDKILLDYPDAGSFPDFKPHVSIKYEAYDGDTLTVPFTALAVKPYVSIDKLRYYA